MNIFPKELDLHDGSTSCSFNIHNTCGQSKLLLYKIRRSEPQLVTFYPKHGVVKPGEMHEVELNLVNEKVTKAKVLVKAVVISTSLITKRNHNDFELIWSLGAQSAPVSKKIVKITNRSNASTPRKVKPAKSKKSRYADGDDDDEELDSSQSMSAESILTESDESALMNTPSPKKSRGQSLSSYADGFANKFNAHAKPGPKIVPNPSEDPVSDSRPVASTKDDPEHEPSSENSGFTISDEYDDTSDDIVKKQGRGGKPPSSVPGIPGRQRSGTGATETTAALSQAAGDSADESLEISEEEEEPRRKGGSRSKQAQKGSRKPPAAPENLTEVVSAVVMQTLQQLMSQSGGALNLSASVDTGAKARGKQHKGSSRGRSHSPAEVSRRSWSGSGSNLLSLDGSEPSSEEEPPRRSHSQSQKPAKRHQQEPGGDRSQRKLEAQAAAARVAHHDQYMQYMAVLADISAMRHIAGGGNDVVIEVKGASEETTDATIHDALEWRIGHVLLEEQEDETVRQQQFQSSTPGTSTNLITKRNMTIDIQYTPLVSLMEGIGSLFTVDKERDAAEAEAAGRAPATEAEQKLKRIQYVMANQQVQHIIVNHTAVKLLQVTALNRFQHLQTLDLSHNNITSISNGMLSLPLLTLLDLSNNMLKSLDFLQELLGLKVLNASANKISSLTMSVHMLLPLADSLVTLDLSLNPVAYHKRYCEDVLDICPKIRHLDGRDLAVLHEQNVQKKHGHVAAAGVSPTSSPGADGEISAEDLEFENRLRRVLKHKEFSEIRKEMHIATSKAAAGEEKSGVMNRSLSRNVHPTTPPSPVEPKRRYSPPTTSATTPMSGRAGLNNNSSVRDAPKSPGNANNISNISAASSVNNTLNNVSLNASTAQDHLGGLKNKKKPVARMSISYNPADPLYKTAVHDHEPHGVDGGNSMNANPFTNAQTPRGRSVSPTATPKPRSKSPAVSSSLLSLTGSQKLRRQSYGIVETASEHQQAVALAEQQERELAQAQYASDAERSGLKVGNNSFTPGRNNASTPQFMRGTSSTRCRRASFDLHCLDQAGGSLSAASVLHRSYLNDAEMNSPEGKARIANASSLTSTLGSARPEYAQDQSTIEMSERLFKEGVAAAPLKELVEDERFSIWHPRYRMPTNGVHGFSKPFSKSVQLKKGLAPHPPLFEKTVLRMREGFQKLPLRGTFTRASKGLTAEWYPMDVQDLEAIRRRGYFHETIGDIQKYSYRDFSTMIIESGGATSGDLNQSSAVLERSGSQLLAATKANRRGSIGQHVSRQYASTEKLVEEDHRFRDPEDTYSGFMKWDTRAAAVAITDTMKKRRSSVTNHLTHSTGSISDTRSNNGNDGSYSPASFNYQRGNYDDDERQQGQPLSINTNNWDDNNSQNYDGNNNGGDNNAIYQNTSNFVPFQAGEPATEPKRPSYISSLFGKLGMDQPEIPTAANLQQQSEPPEPEPESAGYTSDPGYSSKHNGSSRYEQMNPSTTSGSNASAPAVASTGESSSFSAAAELGAQTGDEQKQIDAYLAWLEAQETEGGSGSAAPTAAKAGSGPGISADAMQDRGVAAVRSGFVPNDLHIQHGLDGVEEEKWEAKLRQAKERGDDT